jgi:molecular chaperone DnaK
MSYAFGIDLGTSTSEIAVYVDGSPKVIPQITSRGRSPVMPSVVAVNRSGELVVGEEAVPYADIPGVGVREIKRHMGTSKTVHLGNHNLRPEEVSALILKQLKANAEQFLGQEVKDVVLSVPANFSDAAKQATLNAGRIAGLNIVRLINEPTAAALAFGIQNVDTEAQIVIFDFGGGTLDITVLEMMNGVLDVQCSYGDPYLGGKDIDEAVKDLLWSKFSREHPRCALDQKSAGLLKRLSEEAKIALSSSHVHEVFAPNFAVDNGDLVDFEVQVTREEFERAIAPILNRARECLKQALNSKGIKPPAVDAVLLVGGTTYIPAVRQMVAEVLGKQPRTDVDPDLAVVIGAAVRAAEIAGSLSPEHDIVLTDVSPIGLGIEVVSLVGGQPMFTYDPLIMPNTTIPYSVKRTYSLLYEEQEEVIIKLLQDRTGKARLPEDAEDTGIEGTIRDIPPSSTGLPHPVEVEFSYDGNGLIRLRAWIPATGQSVEINYSTSESRLTDAEIEQAAKKLRELWMTTPHAKQYEFVIKRAERALDTASPSQRQKLSEGISNLKIALVEGNEQNMRATANQLLDLLENLEGAT